MANCEHTGCTERATKILSVGSLGRVEKLCERHVAEEQRQLEPNLVPHHLTGIDAPFSGEQSLQEQIGVLDTDRKQLLAKLEDAQNENARLRELLLTRLERHNEYLTDQVQALEEQNEELQHQLEQQPPTNPEPVTRVD